MEKQTADVLILGSSRAMHHYDPDIIEDSLSMSCFNAGVDGQGILYHNAVLEVILNRYTPKIVILDVNSYELNKSVKTYDLLGVLNPYVKRHPDLRKVVYLKSKFEKYKYISSVYPYNSLLARIVMGNLNVQTKDVSENGFTAQPGIWDGELERDSFGIYELDCNKKAALISLVEHCKANDIQLYMVYSPSYKKYLNVSPSHKYIEEICKRENIEFISFRNSASYMDNELFHDPDHLNDIGAAIFSKDLSHILKEKIILKNKY